MKSCPLCAEEIQDNAIRCKHCGGDIAAHEDNLQSQLASQVASQKSQASSDKRKKIGTTILVVFGVIYGLGVAIAVKANLLVIIGATVITPILLPIAWKVGGWFGRLNQADTIYAAQGQLGIARIKNYLAPVMGAITFSIVVLGIIGVGLTTLVGK